MKICRTKIQTYIKRIILVTLIAPGLVTDLNAQNLKTSTRKPQNAVQDRDWQKGGIFDGYTPDQEIKEKRGKNVKQFRNPDGTITAQIGRSMHYQNASGSWEDINLSIVPSQKSGYQFQNETNEVKTYFPQTPGQGVLMNVGKGVSFSWWQNPSLKFVNNGQVIQNLKPKTVSSSASGDKLLYSNIYNGISEEFVVLADGLENNTIIHQLTPEMQALKGNSAMEFTQFIPLSKGWQIISNGKSHTSDFQSSDFSIRIPGMENDVFFGRIIVFDNNITKDEAFLINAPTEKLSAEEKRKLENSVYTITYKVRFVNGGIEVISSLPSSWLKASSRAFPVTIDPTVTITPTGATSYFYCPMSHWYGYQRNANLFLQSEVGGYGLITQIEYNSTNAGTAGSKPTKIYMRTTAATTLTGTDAWNSSTYIGGATVCLDANTDQGNTTGWKALPLTTPFPYNQDNLLIMVNDAWGGSGSTKYYNMASNIPSRQAAKRVDGTDPGDATTTVVENYLPEIRITYSTTPCAGVPAIGSATATVTETCTNTPFNLGLSSSPAESGITFQWQSSTNTGTTWTNLGAVQLSSSYIVASQSQSTQYRVIVTCTNSSDSDTSSVISVAQKLWNTCYCTNAIAYNCTDGDVITNVTVGSINNNSTCGNTATGYSNYTSSVAPAQLTAGTTIPISVTVGPSGDGWLYESAGVWIDFNQNGSLDSTDNEFTFIGTGLNEVLTANIVVPANALPGNTRMRVIVAASAVLFDSYSCGPATTTENYGEMEDYTVNIIVPVDSVVVTTLGNVPATIATTTGTLQLEATVYPAGSDQSVTWSIVPVTGTATINTDGLVTAQTAGTVWGKAVSVSNTAKSDSILITISNPAIVIDSVVVTTLGNVPATIATTTGTLQLEATVYPAGSDQSVTWSIVPVTGTATISSTGLVTAQTTGTVWGKAVSVTNTAKSDSILITISNPPVGVDSVVVRTQGNVVAAISTPSGTLQLVSNVYPSTLSQAVTWSIIPVSGSATISASGLVTAQTNGGVWGKAVSTLNPLKSDSIFILITNQGLGIETLSGFDFSFYPNPTEGIVTVKSSNEHGALKIQVTDLSGKILKTNSVSSNELNNGVSIDISNFSAGMYIIQLKGETMNVYKEIIKQ